MKKQTYCFDFDGTLCTNTEGDYENAKPLHERIEKVNKLYEQGHRIIIFTARGTVTKINWKELTEKQANEWGIKYHELLFGKPAANYYVDDKGINDQTFFAQ
jgi:hydroxymethylpyrimidine pyrophosphatase-like HAD family hydrolase